MSPVVAGALALVLSVVTALLAVPAPAERRSPARWRPTPGAAPAPDHRGLGRGLAGVAGAAVLVGLGGLLEGARGGVVGAALVVAGATVLRLVVLHARDRRAVRARSEVARACGVLASYVRVGQVPAEALVLVAADCPVLAEAAAVQQIGGDVPGALRARAEQPGHGGLLDLARAWQVTSSSGAPMAPALEEVASGLASDESLRSVVSAELAAPRSTGKLMAVLPLVGVGLGYLLGGRPLEWLVAGPVGWACLLLGLLMAAAGVLWIEGLARAAAAGG